MKIEKDATPKKTTYTEVFGEWMIHAAEREPTLVGVTPAMREGSGLVAFAKAHPDRYHDVGIAEQHAVTFAAGLACEGLRPVVAIYSTFLQRAYDQLIHDICIQNLPVIFAIDRGGLVGADGVTHHGAFDLSYLRCIPNLTVMAPADEDEAWKMLNTALSLNSPVAVRYPPRARHRRGRATKRRHPPRRPRPPLPPRKKTSPSSPSAPPSRRPCAPPKTLTQPSPTCASSNPWTANSSASSPPVTTGS